MRAASDGSRMKRRRPRSRTAGRAGVETFQHRRGFVRTPLHGNGSVRRHRARRHYRLPGRTRQAQDRRRARPWRNLPWRFRRIRRARLPPARDGMTDIGKRGFRRTRLRRIAGFRLARREFRTLDENRRRGLRPRRDVSFEENPKTIQAPWSNGFVRTERRARLGADLALLLLFPAFGEHALRFLRARIEERRDDAVIHRFRGVPRGAFGYGGDLSHRQTQTEPEARARRDRVCPRVFGTAFRSRNPRTLALHGPRIRRGLLLLDIRRPLVVCRNHGRPPRHLFLHSAGYPKIT